MQMLAQNRTSPMSWPISGIHVSKMLHTTIGNMPCSQNCRREMRPDGEVNSLIQ